MLDENNQLMTDKSRSKSDLNLSKYLIPLRQSKNIPNVKQQIEITKEITTHNDFSAGDNKYQKPFKACGTLCEYFSSFKQNKETELITI